MKAIALLFVVVGGLCLSTMLLVPPGTPDLLPAPKAIPSPTPEPECYSPDDHPTTLVQFDAPADTEIIVLANIDGDLDWCNWTRAGWRIVEQTAPETPRNCTLYALAAPDGKYTHYGICRTNRLPWRADAAVIIEGWMTEVKP